MKRIFTLYCHPRMPLSPRGIPSGSGIPQVHSGDSRLRGNDSNVIKFWKVYCFFLCFLFFLQFSFALEIPSSPSGRVNDYAGILSSSARAELESKLQKFEEETSNQVVLVTFPSLEGESLEDFSIRLAEKWKIGQKGRDNGVILLIFKNDRKLRIEVGYGLEGVLPDATGKSIIQNEIVPHFKRGDFESGIFSGIEAILAATKGEYKATKSKEKQGLSDYLALILFLGFWGFGFLAILSRVLRGGRSTTIGSRRSAGFWGGSFGSGGFGGGGGFSGGGGSFGGGGSSGSW